jgi:hypothetical protein
VHGGARRGWTLHDAKDGAGHMMYAVGCMVQPSGLHGIRRRSAVPSMKSVCCDSAHSQCCILSLPLLVCCVPPLQEPRCIWMALTRLTQPRTVQR